MLVDIVLPSPVAARSNWLFLHSCNQRCIFKSKMLILAKGNLNVYIRQRLFLHSCNQRNYYRMVARWVEQKKSNLDIVQITLDPQSHLAIPQKISNSHKNWQQFAFQNLETTIIVLLIKHFWLKSSRNFCRQNSAKF